MEDQTKLGGETPEAPGEAVPFWTHLAPFGAGFFVTGMLGDFAPWKVAAGFAVAVAVALRFRPWRDAPVWAHVAPFFGWVTLMSALGEPSGWTYALRAAVGLVLLLALRPWRWYPAPRARHLPLATLVGIAVFAVWVLPETRWFADRAPAAHTFYLRYLVGLWPFGKLPDPLTATPYAPEVCGWPLALARLVGSAFVIAVAEEFFWRSFLYRWLMAKKWLEVDLGRFDRTLFFTVNVLFGLEHDRWLAGIVAGLAYGWIVLRTRDLWAACWAHVVTNFLLGLYVLAAGAYAFW